jgi:hypothetical protein
MPWCAHNLVSVLEPVIPLQKPMPEINREGRKKRELRNLLRRGRKWYWKKMINGKVQPLSLGTDDLELAKARRDKLERNRRRRTCRICAARDRAPERWQGHLPKYEALGGLMHKTIRANISSMMTVWKVALGKEQLDPADVRLDAFSPRMVRDYQDNLRRRYELAAGTDEKERRMARDKADRTSKSTIGQAQSIFCKRRQFIERYREAWRGYPEGRAGVSRRRRRREDDEQGLFPAQRPAVEGNF